MALLSLIREDTADLCEELSPSIPHQVGDEKREWEEEQAEDEEQDEAVALASGDTGRPEGDEDPDDEQQNRAKPPAS
jgi:hypothetical protein